MREHYRIRKGRLMKRTITNHGYYCVGLYKGARRCTWWHLHRVIALTFLGPSDRWINHVDNDKLNNRVENLEYVTPQGNTAHMLASGRANPPRGRDHHMYGKHGALHPRSSLTAKQRIRVKELRRSGLKLGEIALRFGISKSTVHNVCRSRY